MSEALRVAMAGGGTGGHVYPALSIAEAIRNRRPDADFLFFGTAGKIESRVIPQKGYSFRNIWISGIRRSASLSNLLVPAKMAVSFAQAWSALRSFGPHVAVGTGGYVCGPVLTAAALLRIPTAMHESNSIPGATTRALASRIDLILLGYDAARDRLSAARRVETVGTPVRLFGILPDRREARRRLGLAEEGFTVFVLGGSQGAESLNAAVLLNVEKLRSEHIQVIWQTGAANLEAVKMRVPAGFPGSISGFIEDMSAAYAAADVVIARAGASTLAELSVLGLPSVLVPYPHAADDHQTKNARTFADAGASMIIGDDEIGTMMTEALVGLRQSQDSLRRMSAASRSLGRPDAADVIAEKIIDLVSWY